MTRKSVWCWLAVLVASPAAAQPAARDEEPDVVPQVVPVEQAPYHVPAFRNELVTVLNVHIPPQRSSGYHRHSLDSIGVLVNDTALTRQTLGGEPTVAAPRDGGSTSFSGYAREPLVHRVTVTGDAPFHNIVVELRYEQPGRFTPGTRGEPYEQILDNERARVWRLVLEPGETAPPVTQAAPGVRVVIAGGELVEIVPGALGTTERGMAPRSGEFFWQESGATRAVRNVGPARIELVELELK